MSMVLISSVCLYNRWQHRHANETNIPINALHSLYRLVVRQDLARGLLGVCDVCHQTRFPRDKTLT